MRDFRTGCSGENFPIFPPVLLSCSDSFFSTRYLSPQMSCSVIFSFRFCATGPVYSPLSFCKFGFWSLPVFLLRCVWSAQIAVGAHTSFVLDFRILVRLAVYAKHQPLPVCATSACLALSIFQPLSLASILFALPFFCH